MADSLRIVEQAPWNKAEAYRPDPIEMLRERLNSRSTMERIGDALGSDRMFPLYLAFIAGTLFSMSMAIFWARVL